MNVRTQINQLYKQSKISQKQNEKLMRKSVLDFAHRYYKYDKAKSTVSIMPEGSHKIEAEQILNKQKSELTKEYEQIIKMAPSPISDTIESIKPGRAVLAGFLTGGAIFIGTLVEVAIEYATNTPMLSAVAEGIGTNLGEVMIGGFVGGIVIGSFVAIYKKIAKDDIKKSTNKAEREFGESQ